MALYLSASSPQHCIRCSIATTLDMYLESRKQLPYQVESEAFWQIYRDQICDPHLNRETPTHLANARVPG
jgi:hypothetical protein